MMSDKISMSSNSDANASVNRASIYEVLHNLASEIETNIKILSTESRYKVDEDIKLLREASYRERSPEAEYVSRLFKKFAEVAINAKNNTNSNNKQSSVAVGDVVFGKVNVPSYIYDGSAEQIVGFEAAKKSNIFYYRCACILFSFLCFVILSTVPFINAGVIRPHDEFTPACTYNNDVIIGTFNMRPFSACIAAASCVFVFNILFNVYYILPVDNNNHKYVPGLHWCIEYLHVKFGSDELTISNSRAMLSDGTTRVGSFCKVFSKMIEVILDASLTIFAFLACIIASIIVERGSRFDMGDGSIIYYTLGTFYETFAKTSPKCVDDSPTEKIRAGLAMLYICLFCLVLTLQVSARGYIKESRVKLNSTEGGDARNLTSQTHTLLSNKDVDEIVEVSL